MIEPLQLVRSQLAEHGLSMTGPRATVFRVLASSEPLTMRELLQQCCPETDRASVYRTIGLFERISIVNRIAVGWKYRLELSDSFQQHHHHVHCLRCEAVVSLPENAALEQRLQQLAKEAGFELQDHQLELRGYCQNCRSHQQTEPAVKIIPT
ncbi:MAG TPA: Fur family transcriptional regulator [Candidatus Limnocylindrales bacterium]|nr:Fur family transcriptional regulator [Candidatus Limnocylindrales bacterium]